MSIAKSYDGNKADTLIRSYIKGLLNTDKAAAMKATEDMVNYTFDHLSPPADKVRESLREMCDLWNCLCTINGWDPQHMTQYQKALDSLKS
jgi:hypothetical protein